MPDIIFPVKLVPRTRPSHHKTFGNSLKIYRVDLRPAYYERLPAMPEKRRSKWHNPSFTSNSILPTSQRPKPSTAKSLAGPSKTWTWDPTGSTPPSSPPLDPEAASSPCLEPPPHGSPTSASTTSKPPLTRPNPSGPK